MTTPGYYSLNIYRGDTYRWQFKLWSDSGKTVPFDLAGITPKAEIRDKPGGSLMAELALTIEAPNIIHAELTAEESGGLVVAGAWDLQLTHPDADVTTILAGHVSVTGDVTDSG